MLNWGAGTGRSGSNSYYKYDYAVVFARNGDTLTGAYNIVSLNGATTVTQTYDWSGTLFDWSNPFRVGDGSEALPNGGGTTFTPRTPTRLDLGW